MKLSPKKASELNHTKDGDSDAPATSYNLIMVTLLLDGGQTGGSWAIYKL